MRAWIVAALACCVTFVGGMAYERGGGERVVFPADDCDEWTVRWSESYGDVYGVSRTRTEDGTVQITLFRRDNGPLVAMSGCGRSQRFWYTEGGFAHENIREGAAREP